jgi:NAD(P)-dependent dehydrogenase (short-subunit alcohol dehydrogenase family)
MGSPTVLVFGGDLGFVLALAHELSNRHVATILARTAREAGALLTRFRLNPDLLVIDRSSPDASSSAERLMKKRPEVKIIGIVSDGYACEKLANQLVATFRDPDDTGPERISHCAAVIEQLLRAHLRLIQDARET